ncbi:uncharacterized protein [Haliotis cracherodii]|uniref:uncharacterized protein n=1 Tax=Haliotis cracherodii TaxID=6455 RepID=UPI0039EBD9A1
MLVVFVTTRVLLHHVPMYTCETFRGTEPLYSQHQRLHQQQQHHQQQQCPAPMSRPSATSAIAAVGGLSTVDPQEYGAVKVLNLTKTRTHRRITLAMNPPLFEIPGFLAPDECDHIIRLAQEQGLEDAATAGWEESVVHTDDLQDVSSRDRTGQTTFLDRRGDPLLAAIEERVSILTELPLTLIKESEDLQVAHYGTQGHYHAHFDTDSDWRLDDPEVKPCCFQIEPPRVGSRCIFCRFATVMMYLNDVEEGGETAFPVADLADPDISAENENLSFNCYKASVVVKPKKGTAVFWYNNYVDEDTGWIGEHDPFSLHGGCDVIRGEKWIANLWISAPTYRQRHYVHDDLHREN